MIPCFDFFVAIPQECCKLRSQGFLLRLEDAGHTDTHQPKTPPSEAQESCPFQLTSLRGLLSGFDTNLDGITNLYFRLALIDFNEAGDLHLPAKQGGDVAELLHVL